MDEGHSLRARTRSGAVVWLLRAAGALFLANAGCNLILDNQLHDVADGSLASTVTFDGSADAPNDATIRDAGVSDASPTGDAPVGRDAGDGGCAAGQTACNGACVSLSAVHTCGSCANDCASLPGVSDAGLVCQGGACSYSCRPGYGDCADAGVGCTVPLDTPGDCGGCGISCPTSSPLCAQSDAGAYACGSSCPSGQTDCSGTCADLTSDGTHCGSCTNACPTAQTCVHSACQCPSASSLDFCAGACTSLQSDAANCGSCGHACTGGATCQAGACACPTGTTLCGGTCVNASSDAMHCGASCKTCTGGATCQAGVCACPAGTTLCGGSCVNVHGTDVSNCGACGTSCADLPHVSPAGLACSGGVCSYQCAAGFSDCADAGIGCGTSLGSTSNCGKCGSTCSGVTPVCAQPDGGTGAACATGCAMGQSNCSGTCTFVSSDATNCGQCAHACPATQICSAGACGCGVSQSLCGTACTSLLSDNNNCGKCGNACPAAATCQNGVCACPPSSPALSLCGTTCVNPQTDNNNCGACGTKCTSPESCQSGSCACPAATPPQTFCTDVCTNTQTDNANCGTCGTKCTTTVTGAAASCGAGACRNACTVSVDTICGTACTNIKSDNNNCGACGTKCTSPESCQSGSCACPAATPPQTFCTNVCTNTQADNANCGACGKTCSSGQHCSSGLCVCDATSCNGCCTTAHACVLLASENNTTCGSVGATCGACAAGVSCNSVGGMCLGCTGPTQIPESLSGFAQASGDGFGTAVAISGSVAVVGAPGAFSGEGEAYVFIQSGSTWTSPGNLFPGTGVTAYGSWVGISGTTVAVLGMAGGTTSTVYVFTKVGTGFFLQTSFVPQSDSTIFSRSIAMDGSTIVVGGIASAAVYVGSGASWTLQGTLTPSDFAPASGFFFGGAVAISADTIVLEAEPSDSSGESAHWLYVFTRSGTTWSQQGARIVPTGLVDNNSPHFNFNFAVNGNTIVLATNSDGATGTTQLYAYTRSGNVWTEKRVVAPTTDGNFGAVVAMTSTRALVGSASFSGGTGAVYPIGVANGAPIIGPASTDTTGFGVVNGDSFGGSLAMSGATTIVGAPGTNTSTLSSVGAAYVYSCSP